MEFFPNSNDNFQNCDFDYQEYYLIKNNIAFKISVEKNENKIVIKINNYLRSFNLKELSELTKNDFNSMNKAYKFIVNIFECNNVTIKNIISNKEIILLLKVSNDNEKELSLLINKNNKTNYIYEMYKIKNDINYLKNENNKLKKEIDILKSYHNNPKKLDYLSKITKDSYSLFDLDNIFTVFQSINNILYLIYANQYKTIICYDLKKQSTIAKLKKCHNEHITNINHYLDKKNKMDLIMSISSAENRLKIWNVNDWNCILDISHIYNNNNYLFSACFLNENNKNYIITSNCNWLGDSGPVKIFDFNQKIIKEIKDSNEKTYFISTYYDKALSKNYIITGNLNYVKSYDYTKNELYHKYNDNENNNPHLSIIIKSDEKIIKLIESCHDGCVRIWDFHSCILLKKIRVSNKYLYGINLWSNYLFVGCEDKTIKIIDLKLNITIKNLIGHNNRVLSIKKINHPIYGDCILSQGWKNDQILIWINKS